MKVRYGGVVWFVCCFLVLVSTAWAGSAVPAANGLRGRTSGAAALPAWVPSEPGESSPRMVRVRILAFNDFHGQIIKGRTIADRPVGSAPVLAAYLAKRAAERPTIIVHAGDLVGASPPQSGLLQDEPAMMFVNRLANSHCSSRRRLDPRCNLVGTLGNHEFDEGLDELLRMIYGGNYPKGPYLEDPYSGAHFPYICANVVYTDDSKPVLPPFVIKVIAEIPVGFIGAVVRNTPAMVDPEGIQGLSFLDEAESINRYAKLLKKLGVETIIAVVHQGGVQDSYQGPTNPAGPELTGKIVDLVTALDDEIDVVISGHTHEFTNALIRNQHGVPILVTQAWAKSVAFGDIRLVIDRQTRDVLFKSARIETTWADAGAGLNPDPEVQEIVDQAEEMTGPIIQQVIAQAAKDILRQPNDAGESALGDLVADAQKTVAGVDFAFMNPGGIRADIAAGQVTWGDLYTVQPFGNAMVKMQLSGKQIHDLLNEQWAGRTEPKILQISGLTYTWDANRPEHDRIVEVLKDGVLIDESAYYSVGVIEFLASGGDDFTIFADGKDPVVGGNDLDVLIQYIQSLPQPFSAAIDGRITCTATGTGG